MSSVESEELRNSGVLTDCPDVIYEESCLEEELEEGVEEKVADCSSTSSMASVSSPAPSSSSPAPKVTTSATVSVIGDTAADAVPEFQAPVEWQPEWNGIAMEPNGEYFVNGSSEHTYIAPVPGTAHLEGTPLLVPRPPTVHIHNHPVCSGGGTLHHPPRPHSPHMQSPGSHSSHNTASPTAPQQYVVNVHVNPGETFSVRVGDDVQLIQGPATVRMVSNSGPPMPMPMQVPPGHMVQQIVDENGILTHVILSPQLPGMPAPPMMAAPNGSPSQMYAPYASQYSSFPPHFAPHHHPMPPRHFHSMAPPHMHVTTPPSPSTHQCTSHNHPMTFEPSPVCPHSNQVTTDYRAQKMKARLQEKVKRKAAAAAAAVADAHQSQLPSLSSQVVTTANMNTTSLPANHERSKSESSVDGPELEKEYKLMQELLSKMPPPEVSSIEARCALVRLTPPKFSASEMGFDPSEIVYLLQLSDKKDGNFKHVYSGSDAEVPLTKLLPATDYHLRAFCKLDDLQGEPVSAVVFRTLSAEPDLPSPPKMASRNKSSIQLKWTAPNDNGSKITSYHLEYDQGTRNLNKFVEIYTGPQKTFKVTKLAPSVAYAFRLAAANAIGKSDYSEPVVYCTSGTAPSQTDPPKLYEQNVKALTITWTRRPSDDSFTLQMEDEATGHGFLTVYNGSDLSYKVINLRRNTEYKFRLQASNDEGSSKWSDVVSYRTFPDRPGPPSKPQLKGRAITNSFKVVWDQPKDNGGAEITNYLLQLDDGMKKLHSAREREFTAERLQPGFTYRIRVQAVGQGGTSEWSEVLLVTTQAVCPGQCKPPRLHGRPKATYLSIAWDCPEYDGGSQVTEYALCVRNCDKSAREAYRGSDLECAVAGLLPGRMYTFEVRAFNKAGAGPWSDPLEVVTGAGVPDSPQRPDMHCKSPHIVVVSWDEPQNNGAAITEYRLEWQAKEEPEFIPLYCGMALMYEAMRLAPATTYAFRVQAVNSAGVSPFSEVGICQTPPSSPSAVVSLRTIAMATSIQLVWKEPPSNGAKIISYNIDIGERQMFSIENVTEYIIDNLLPETTYKIRIQAVNSIGVGAFSSPIKVTTNALPPNAPHLECITVGPKFLKMKWGDGKNTDLTQYCLEMMREHGSFQVIYQGTAQTHKVTKLNEQTQYCFRIYATNEAGSSPASEVFTCSTTKAPPGVLKSPKVREISLNSCIVEWNPVKPIGQDTFIYILQLQSSTMKDQEFIEVYRGAEQVFELTNLAPKTDYHVRVCAVRQSRDGSDDLIGPFSPGTVFTTSGVKSSLTLTSELNPTKSQSKLTSVHLSENQRAFLILLGFAFFAVVLAYGAKEIIEKTGNVASSLGRN